eukprot:CAMPEP_0185902550 /NCGR_PEP_ID=MMETSP0196C-20130402/1784_1 /TAXON_ID=2932 /ORGANISM="Alexandrium fundyense, Strain CCMP1719" /LENGTH=41 /DNA_ID= /DNA_START= /DNA_END= /DNA_ORIENTATION=
MSMLWRSLLLLLLHVAQGYQWMAHFKMPTLGADSLDIVESV